MSDIVERARLVQRVNAHWSDSICDCEECAAERCALLTPMADEIESLRSWLADAEREARVLVVAMADQFGAPDNWKPLPDAAGMITQISNMVAGLRDERALLVTRAENAEAALAYAVSTGDECAIEVEALRKRLAAWETAAHRGHPSPCTLGPLCPYCEIESLRSRLAEACDELRNIANAQPSKWEPDMADQFQSWAQSRARHTLARIDAHLAEDA